MEVQLFLIAVLKVNEERKIYQNKFLIFKN